MTDMKERFQNYFQTSKTYIRERSELFIGIGVVVALVAITGIVALIINLNGPHIVYQPTKACDLLTPEKAGSLLGEKVISVDSNAPQISGNVAQSKCSFTDANTDTDKLMVAAVAVRSAINDEGDIQNKNEFAAARANNNTDTVTGIGDSAYFNKTNGLLHVLKGHNWFIISFGVGSDQANNTVDNDVKLAQKLLN